MNRRPLLRVIAALAASVLSIYVLSIIKSGPSAAADFDCSSDPGQRTASIDVASGETGLEIARELFEKDVIASSEVFFRLAVADPKAALIAPGVHMIDTQICAKTALDQLLDSKRIAGLIAVSEGAWISEIKKLFTNAGYPQGEIKAFPAVEMVFHPVQNLVEFLVSPAAISREIEREAEQIAVSLIDKMGLVGVLAVEMFLTKDGKILINEVAPRPHNSGHQTIRANDTSQYEQHLRAITGLPLGDTYAHSYSGMLNLLGSEGFTGPAKYEGLDTILGIPGVHPFLYGKKITKPFRKMGHITLLAGSREEIEQKAELVKQSIRVIA